MAVGISAILLPVVISCKSLLVDPRHADNSSVVIGPRPPSFSLHSAFFETWRYFNCVKISIWSENWVAVEIARSRSILAAVNDIVNS